MPESSTQKSLSARVGINAKYMLQCGRYVPARYIYMLARRVGNLIKIDCISRNGVLVQVWTSLYSQHCH